LLFCTTVAFAETDITLAWDANTEQDLSGYRLHYGNLSGSYSESVDVGNVLEHTIKNLPDGIWYFAATAYDGRENESGYSNEVSTHTDTTSPLPVKNLIIKIIIKIGQ
jgi:hypothetical protein